MPTLHWIGKEKVINHHLDVPFRALEHSYGFDNGKQKQKETGSGNKIIQGDNLEALKTLLPEYEGKIKCIYIEPSYNTGNEGWVHNDTSYYFHYEPEVVTILNYEFLSGIKEKAVQYVIYADNCLLTKDFMAKHHIIFKKIPRVITRL